MASAREIAAAYLRRPRTEQLQIMERLGVDEESTVDAIARVRERRLVPALAKILGLENNDSDESPE